MEAYLKKALIVSPNFPPTNAADHQRVRMSLPYLSDFGWEATILAVDPNAIEGMPLDPLLEQTFSNEIAITRVRALDAGKTRRFGLGNLALRALPYLWRAGNRLLAMERFDVIFFSTTEFPVMILGPIWKRKFGVPYVVDFQDPWLGDYYERTGTPPPGGKLRYRLSSTLARQLEPRVVRDVSQVIAVSPAYVQTIRTRYPALSADRLTVLPFAAPEHDFQLLPSLHVRQSVFDPTDGRRHWVYVGRGGADMAQCLRVFFAALRQLRAAEPGKWEQTRFHFVGTSYAGAGKGAKTIEPIASELGVADLVEERTDRIRYFETLQLLTGADALLIIGSDSPAYTPSKIYPYVLARRPLLAVLHEKSPATEILRRCRAGRLVTFGSKARGTEELDTATAGLEETRRDVESGATPDVDWEEFRPYTAREMTRKMCEVFDRVVAR